MGQPVEAILFCMGPELTNALEEAGGDRFLTRLQHSGLQSAVLREHDGLSQIQAVPHALKSLAGQLNSSELGSTLESAAVALGTTIDGMLLVMERTRFEAIDWEVIHGARPVGAVLLDMGMRSDAAGGLRTSDANGLLHVTIGSLQALPRAIAQLQRKCCPPLCVIAYMMRWDREENFLRRLAFPWGAAQTSGGGGPPCRVCFFPLELGEILAAQHQLADADVLLVKATDFLEAPTSEEVAAERTANFEPRLRALLDWCAVQAGLRVVDSLGAIAPTMDRVAMLTGFSNMLLPSGARLRPPRMVKLAALDGPSVDAALEEAQLQPPYIIKPLAASGVKFAHKMAVVLERAGLATAPVPVPCVVQEYVDHGGVVHKVYVLGEALFTRPRKSTPDAALLAAANQPFLAFDSQKPWAPSPSIDSEPLIALDEAVVHEAAQALRQKLGLTLFGFDLLVQRHTGDHLIVDVNFFPSFKDIPQNEAVPAFWRALSSSSCSLGGRSNAIVNSLT